MPSSRLPLQRRLTPTGGSGSTSLVANSAIDPGQVVSERIGLKQVMTKRVRYVIASITTAGAVALTILAGSRSLRNSDGSEVEPQSEPVEPQPEPVEPQPELRSNPLPDRNVPGDSSAGSVSSVRWGRRLLPPQWIVFLVLAAALSIKAFGYLPPESQDLSSELSPTIDISVIASCP
jgi:hypothetical protein